MIESQLTRLPEPMHTQALTGFHEFIDKTKNIFAVSLSEVFFIAAILAGISLFVAFFLKEIPLRKTHAQNPAEEAGKELAVEEGNFPSASEPKIR
jgi:hypothetical protein